MPEMRRVKCHEIKSWPESFEAVYNHQKTFEVRQNDRSYHTGDYLLMFEWDPKTERYTGQHVMCRVGMIAQDRWGLPPGLCVMEIVVVDADTSRYEDGTLVPLPR